MIKSILKLITERFFKTVGFSVILIIYNYFNPAEAENLIQLIGTAMIFIAIGNFPSPLIYSQNISNAKKDDYGFHSARMITSLLISVISLVLYKNIFLSLFILTNISNVSAHKLHSLETKGFRYILLISTFIICSILKLIFAINQFSLNFILLISALENLFSIIIFLPLNKINLFNISHFFKKIQLKFEFHNWLIAILYTYVLNFDSQFIIFQKDADYYYFVKKGLDFFILISGWASFLLPSYFARVNKNPNNFKSGIVFLILISAICFILISVFLAIIYNSYFIILTIVPIIIFDAYSYRLEIFNQNSNLILYVYISRLIILTVFANLLSLEINYFVYYFSLSFYLSLFIYFILKKWKR